MKASELRIGNLITDEYGNFLTVKAIPMEHRNFIEAKGEGNLRLLYLSHQDKMIGWGDFEKNSKANFKEPIATPITLTEEWFVKFNFSRDEMGYLGKENSIYSFVDRGDLGFMLVIADIEYKESYVKQVHQLQNLWFALQDEELTIKQQ